VDRTQTSTQDPAQDARGWKHGQGRKWGNATRRRFQRLHAELEHSPRTFYGGASAVLQRYRVRYPDVDIRLDWFNESSLAYTCHDVTARKHRTSKKDFVPMVYFIRQVREDADTSRASIDILNEAIAIPKAFVNYFVLAKWNLADERPHVLIERGKQLRTIKSADFRINPNSKHRLE
jgi:hypothetical protein